MIIMFRNAVRRLMSAFLVLFLCSAFRVNAQIASETTKIVIELTDYRSGYVTVNETVLSVVFSDEIRNNIRNGLVSMDKIESEKIKMLNEWVFNATLSNAQFKILNLEEMGEPLQAQTNADFYLNYDARTNDGYFFYSISYFSGEIFQNVILDLFLPLGSNSTSTAPSASFSEENGRTIIRWTVVSGENLEAHYVKSEVGFQPPISIEILAVVAATIVGIYIIARRRHHIIRGIIDSFN
jgi:hypothetical protein